MATVSRALEILAELVAMRTVPGEANAAWVSYVSSRLSAIGCRIVRVPSSLGDCEGVIASLGPPDPGGLVLSGHMDVVDVAGQDWTVDPFRLTARGGRVYGRGTTDMKGFLACALALVEAHSARAPDRPLHLAISGDEETTCRSAVALAEHLTARLPPVRGVIVGEQTGLRAANRHRGAYTLDVEVTGQAGHASRPDRGLSAIALAAQLILWLEARSDGALGPGTTDAGTTHSVGRISGGTATNIIAERCGFSWDVRLAPEQALEAEIAAFDDAAERLLAGVRTRAPAAAVSVSVVAAFPGFLTPPDTPFACDCESLAAEPGFVGYDGATEAGIYQARGLPAIVMGPGDIADAHVADESLAVDQLEACCALLARLA